MFEALKRDDVQAVLSLDGRDQDWKEDFDRLLQGDTTLTVASAHEGAVRALQRLLVFLGYSTASTGAFAVDGDFGAGTNRGVAQFQFEHGLAPAITREQLTYPASYQTAAKGIVAIPAVDLDLATLDRMISAAATAIDSGAVTCGNFADALFHLNALQLGSYLSCKEILARYGAAAQAAVAAVAAEKGVAVVADWVLAIVRQETAGVVRPRFEQHLFSGEAAKNPAADLRLLRYRAMSMGLGQILGRNFAAIGTASPEAMILSSTSEQLAQVARFLLAKQDIVTKTHPVAADFAALARFYNGPQYGSHGYDTSLQRWWNELRRLRQAT